MPPRFIHNCDVIVVNYNVGKLLGECVASALREGALRVIVVEGRLEGLDSSALASERFDLVLDLREPLLRDPALQPLLQRPALRAAGAVGDMIRRERIAELIEVGEFVRRIKRRHDQG